MTKLITRIAPDVGWLPISFANVYFIGRPGGKWILLDSGLPGRAHEIMEAAEARFGAGSRPEAIVLTHGHTDHVGSALTLAKAWDVFVYAHRLEMPYVSGKSPYPPADPTVGGAIGFLSRFIPSGSHDLGEHLRQLQPGKVPGETGWKWIATPGHSPGHISLFRSSDRVLLAGDAVATMNLDSWSGLFSGKQTLAHAGAPFTMDWEAARSSVQELANLRPNVIGCGHGIPMCDAELPERMEAFAERFRAPRHGRYVRKPAKTNENGIVDLPPAPFDPVPLATAASLVLVGIAIGAGYLDDETRRK
jgi:glyoxylase-like metal-dependent hydrolase (beta-lactamase superfamily II)